MPVLPSKNELGEGDKILDNTDGTAPKAVPEDTSEIGEDGIPLSPRLDPSGVQFISPKRGSTNGDAKVELGGVGSIPQFVGLGKEELMKYANDPFWVRLRWILFILFWIIWIGMLLAAIAIIIEAPKCKTSVTDKIAERLDKTGPYYQIPLDSLPSNSAEITDQINYMLDLGVQTIILSGFQDGTNLYEVDAKVASKETFNELINKLTENKIKIVLQLTPNHSSKEHPWFQNQTDFYVIKNSTEVIDSTWTSVDNDKAWTPIDEEKSYLHQFSVSTADFDYRNEDFVEKMNGILKHWYGISKNVVGFLLADASYLVEDLTKLQDPNATINQPENKEVLKKILESSSWDLEGKQPPFALLDVKTENSEETLEYVGSSPVMTPIWTDLSSNLESDFNALQLSKTIGNFFGHFVVHRLSNRAVRFGTERSNILALICCLLRGEVVMYDGAEKDGNLEFHKALIKLRNDPSFPSEAREEEMEMADNDGLFGFKRGNLVVLVNLNNVVTDVNLVDKFHLAEDAKLEMKLATPNAFSNDKINAVKFPAEAMAGYVLQLATA